MKYFLIAGEASGDLHGSMLIKQIKHLDHEAEFSYWGGDLMAGQAKGLLTHYKEISIMGFVEVLYKLPQIIKNLSRCKNDVKKFRPDVIILIDFPGFNLQMARFAKKNNIKVVYFIAPKVWAWQENRAKILEKYVDKLLLIFPFEIAYFKQWKVDAHYVGNPLFSEIKNFRLNDDFLSKNKLSEKEKIIALLPGSRKQEIERVLPVMMKVAKNIPGYTFVVAAAPSIDLEFYLQFTDNNTKIIQSSTYSILSRSTVALVCSGTASLETAFFKVPQVCIYITSPISYRIGRLFVKIKYMSLVNLCLNYEAVPELLQYDVTEESITKKLESILPNGQKRLEMLQNYEKLNSLFTEENPASKAAEIICNL